MNWDAGDQMLSVIATPECLPGKEQDMPIERSNLRLSDLKTRTPTATRLMNVKLPIEVATAVDRLSKQLNASKTQVVIALLNEALAGAQKKRKH
jgi:hypothetical protein